MGPSYKPSSLGVLLYQIIILHTTRGMSGDYGSPLLEDK